MISQNVINSGSCNGMALDGTLDIDCLGPTMGEALISFIMNT